MLVATDLDVSGNATAPPGASLTSIPQIVLIPCEDSGDSVSLQKSQLLYAPSATRFPPHTHAGSVNNLYVISVALRNEA